MWFKKSSWKWYYEPTIFFTENLVRMVVASALFECCLSIICFLGFFDNRYGLNAKIEFFTFSKFGLFCFCVLIFSFIIAFFIGIIISIPSVVAKFLLRTKLETLEYSASDRKISIFILKFFPLFLLVFMHLSFLLVNLGTSTQFSRRLFDEKGIFYSAITAVHQKLFYAREDTVNEYWQQIARQNKNTEFVFAFPASVMQKAVLFSKLKERLGEQSLWVMTTPTVESLAGVLAGYYQLYHPYIYSPLPVSDFRSWKDKKEDAAKEEYFALSGERLFTFSWLFHPSEAQENTEITKKTVFLNRFILSQPQFFLAARLGLLKAFDPALDWKNMTTSNADLFLSYGRDFLRDGTKREKIAFFSFTELEMWSDNNFYPLRSIRAPKQLSSVEMDKVYKNIDIMLSSIVDTLLKNGVKKILVVPYQDLTDSNFFSYSFSSANIQNKNPSKILIPQAVDKMFTQKKSGPCNAFFINELFYTYNNKILTSYNGIDKKTIDSYFPLISKNISSLLYNQFDPGIFCSLDGKNNFIALPKRVAKTNMDFSAVSLSENVLRGQLFTLNKETGNAHAWPAEFNKQSLSSAQSETVLEFFSKMDLYRIDFYDQIKQVKMQLLDEPDRHNFISSFGSDLFEELKNFILQSLQ